MYIVGLHLLRLVGMAVVGRGQHAKSYTIESRVLR